MLSSRRVAAVTLLSFLRMSGAMRSLSMDAEMSNTSSEMLEAGGKVVGKSKPSAPKRVAPNTRVYNRPYTPSNTVHRPVVVPKPVVHQRPVVVHQPVVVHKPKTIITKGKKGNHVGVHLHAKIRHHKTVVRNTVKNHGSKPCPKRSEDQCMADGACFFRHLKTPRCDVARPGNCQGMTGSDCTFFKDSCHWDFKAANDDWQKACFSGPAVAAPPVKDCAARDEGGCMADGRCFWRPKADHRCVPAEPLNCQGMNGDSCRGVAELCHWDWQKSFCFPGPEETPEAPACVLRSSEAECKRDCLWRPTEPTKCARKLQKNCKGVGEEQCGEEDEICNWDGACFEGPELSDTSSRGLAGGVLISLVIAVALTT